MVIGTDNSILERIKMQTSTWFVKILYVCIPEFKANFLSLELKPNSRKKVFFSYSNYLPDEFYRQKVRNRKN